jgi:hypothetical protein
MPSTFALCFYVFLYFQCVTATDVRRYKEPSESRVNVQLDQMLAVADAKPQRPNTPEVGSKGVPLILMAHQKMSHPISDLQLIKITMDGFMDMLRNGKLYGVGINSIPEVMTAFYFNNQIILASSQRRGRALTYTRGNDLDELVRDCVAPHDKSFQAKCGELSAFANLQTSISHKTYPSRKYCHRYHQM